MRIKSKFIYALLVVAFFISCKKADIQVPDPIIALIVPFNNQSYSVYDTIFIIADIKHVQEINKLSLSINNKDLKPITSGKTIEIHQSNYHLNTFLIIDNRYIEENLNYLLIKIEDRDAVYNFWQPISINPLNRELEDILVVTGTQLDNTLFKVSITGDVEQLDSWRSEYIGGYADSRYHMFYTSGELIDGIRGYGLDENDPLWVIPPLMNSSIPYFNSFTGNEGEVTVGTTEGIIESYNYTGLKILSTKKINGGRYTNIMTHYNLVLGAFKPFSGTQNTLIIFNNPSGSIYASLQFQGDVIDMVSVNKNTVMLIINENGVVKAYTYSYSVNSLSLLHEITTSEISNMSGDSNNLFFATTDGVLWYRPGTGSTVNYLSMNDVSTLAFESGSNMLYFARGSSLYVVGLPSVSILDSIEFNTPIKDINLIYNK